MCDVGDVAVAMGVRCLWGCGVQMLFMLVVAAESVKSPSRPLFPKKRVLVSLAKTQHDPKRVLARAAKTQFATKPFLVRSTKTAFWQELLAQYA